ncbi:MAG: tetratricopeptide repeat protein [Deltaproteobacteria bacterium]|nr:tetratricopeptide repeat protein [Deltaproteobacteria bacterium]
MADARRAPPTPPEPPEPPGTVDFWRDVIEPHADEVQAILGKARDAMGRPDHQINGDTDWAVDARSRFYRDAVNLLAHARRLSPHNVEVLALLGRAADELGDTTRALEALEACARLTGPDRIPTDVTSRLGLIHLRLGDPDAALRWLRQAQGPLSAANVSALVHLASTLAARGEVAGAIDVLTNAMPATALGHYTNEVTMAAFALAVLLDRDEQRSAAFAVIDGMQSALQQQYGSYVQNELARIRFANAEDLHYYRGLLYESLGHYVEARTEWAHYAAIRDTPWRRRALDHIAAIDAKRRASPVPSRAVPGSLPPFHPSPAPAPAPAPAPRPSPRARP